MHPFSREPSSQVCEKKLTSTPHHTTLTCFSGEPCSSTIVFSRDIQFRAGGGSFPTLLLGAMRIHFFLRSWYKMHGMTLKPHAFEAFNTMLCFVMGQYRQPHQLQHCLMAIGNPLEFGCRGFFGINDTICSLCLSNLPETSRCAKDLAIFGQLGLFHFLFVYPSLFFHLSSTAEERASSCAGSGVSRSHFPAPSGCCFQTRSSTRGPVKPQPGWSYGEPMGGWMTATMWTLGLVPLVELVPLVPLFQLGANGKKL